MNWPGGNIIFRLSSALHIPVTVLCAFLLYVFVMFSFRLLCLFCCVVCGFHIILESLLKGLSWLVCPADPIDIAQL